MGGFYVGECPLISPFLKNNGPLHNKLVQLTCHTGIKGNQGVIMTPIITSSTFTPFQSINLFLVKNIILFWQIKYVYLKQIDTKKDFHESCNVFLFNIKQKIMWKGHTIYEILKVVSW